MERGVSTHSSTIGGDSKNMLASSDSDPSVDLVRCPSVDLVSLIKRRAAAQSCVSADTTTVGVRMQFSLGRLILDLSKHLV